MNRESYESLVDFLRDIKSIPRTIELKKKQFSIQLCNPSLSPERAFNKMMALKNEIDYLELKFSELKKILKTIDKRDRYLLKLISENKNIFIMKQQLGMGFYTISHKVDYYSELLPKLLNKQIEMERGL